MGQRGRSFYVRYKEHQKDFKNGHRSSKFAQYLLDNGHAFGTINETMKILHTINKGKMMNTLENLHICRETKHENEINDRNIVTKNILFDAINSE
jgi:hypothetical protein